LPEAMKAVIIQKYTLRAWVVLPIKDVETSCRKEKYNVILEEKSSDELSERAREID
jgi:hypothetical protein